MNKTSERVKTRPLGSVRLEPLGRWYVARMPESVDPRRSPITGRFKTRTAAQKAINEAIKAYTPDTNNTAKTFQQGQTLANLCEQYINERVKDKTNPIGVNTRLYYERNTGQIINKINKFYVKDLTTTSLKVLFSDLNSKHIKFLNIVLNWANETGRIEPVFVPTVKHRHTKSGVALTSNENKNIPTMEQIAIMVSAESLEYRFRVMYLVAAFCGLRLSELLALAPDDIIPGVGVSVDKVFAWDCRSHEFVKEPVKAGISSIVPVPNKLLESLKIVAGSAQNDILFYNNTGERMKVHTFWNMSKRLKRRGEFPQDIKFKSLRSFAGSVVLSSGASVVETAAYLRHTPKVSVSHYLRITPDPIEFHIRESLEGETVAERVEFLYDKFLKEFPQVGKALKI